MKKIPVDYGDTVMQVTVPDSAVVVDPQPIPPPADSATLIKHALSEPRGTRRISEMAKKDSKVTIFFSDMTKPGSYKREIILAALDELHSADVPDKNVKLCCAMGTHRKNNLTDMTNQLGQDLVNRFWPDRLLNHDAADPEGLVVLGESEFGSLVEVNALLKNSDLSIFVGCCKPDLYGGYNGGYKHLVAGLASARSITGHHTFPVSGHEESVHADPEKSLIRRRIDSVGKFIEDSLTKDILIIDAVLNVEKEIIAVYAGRPSEVQKSELAAMEKQWVQPIPKPADVLIVGQPTWWGYGESTNPVSTLSGAGYLARAWRGRPSLNDGGVIITPAVCDGRFNDEWFPSYREVFNLFGKVNLPEELTKYEPEFLTRSDYMYRYRYCYGYHGLHPFWVLYAAQYALQRASRIIIPGARDPGAVRAAQCTSTKNYDDAWRMAKQVVGSDPDIVVLPHYYSKMGYLVLKP